MSISRAAMTVHVAQPALSQQIADLEERTGVQLDRRAVGSDSLPLLVESALFLTCSVLPHPP